MLQTGNCGQLPAATSLIADCTVYVYTNLYQIFDVQRGSPDVVCGALVVDEQLDVSVIAYYDTVQFSQGDFDGCEIFRVARSVDIEEVG